MAVNGRATERDRDQPLAGVVALVVESPFGRERTACS